MNWSLLRVVRVPRMIPMRILSLRFRDVSLLQFPISGGIELEMTRQAESQSQLLALGIEHEHAHTYGTIYSSVSSFKLPS